MEANGALRGLWLPEDPLAVSLTCSLQSSVVSMKGEVTNHPPSGQAPQEESQPGLALQRLCAWVPWHLGQLCSVPFPGEVDPTSGPQVSRAAPPYVLETNCSKNEPSGREKVDILSAYWEQILLCGTSVSDFTVTFQKFRGFCPPHFRAGEMLR